MYTYSLIIPHKNCPEFLYRCLSTVPNREDLEIIVIDDNSVQCIDENKIFHTNIRIIYDSSGKGAGHARNLGLEVATGKWLLFADADDCYTDNFGELLDKYAENNINDIVYLNAVTFNEKNTSGTYIIDDYIKRFLKHRFYSEKVLRYAVFTPWTRMVKKDLVDTYQIRFDEVPIGNDYAFCLACSKYAKKIAVEEKFIYKYYRPLVTTSLTDSYRKVETLPLVLNNRMKMNRIYSECGFIFKFSIIKYYFTDLKKFNSSKVKSIYKDVLKQNRYSLLSDLFNTLMYAFGKVFSII